MFGTIRSSCPLNNVHFSMNNKIEAIQSLRYLYAVLIFLHHFNFNGTINCEPLGACGVSFFLILSGFVMSFGYGEKVVSENFKAGTFLLKRLIRIYPLHVICLLSWLALSISYLSSMKHLAVIGINALLLQSWVPVRSVYFSCNAVSWCLSDLLFFYAMFPLLTKMLNGRWRWIFSTVIFAVYFLVLFIIEDEHLHALVYISPVFRLTDFILGMLLFKLVKCLRLILGRFKVSDLLKSSLEIGSILVTTFAMLYYHDIDTRFTLASWYWIPSAIMIVVFSIFNTGGVVSRLLTLKPLVKLGEASFTFYMIHTLAFTVLGGILKLAGIEMSIWLRLVIYLILVSLAALIIYSYIEKPVSKKLSSLLLK